MKHINVEHISLTNIPKQSDNYSCGVFVYLYSYCASSMINDDLSKDEWCDKFCHITATYDIHKFRKVIHELCLRLQYDEKSTMKKSTSSSSLIIIHDGIPHNVNLKEESNSMIDKSNDLTNQLNNDLSYNNLILINLISMNLLQIQIIIHLQMIVVKKILILMFIHIQIIIHLQMTVVQKILILMFNHINLKLREIIF